MIPGGQSVLVGALLIAAAAMSKLPADACVSGSSADLADAIKGSIAGLLGGAGAIAIVAGAALASLGWIEARK